MYKTLPTRFVLCLFAGAMACSLVGAQTPDQPTRPQGPSVPDKKPELFGDTPTRPLSTPSNTNPSPRMNSQNRPDPQAPSSPQPPTGPVNVKKTPAEQNSYTNETESPVKRPETYRELQEQLARKEKQKAASEEPLTQNDNGNEKENFDRNEETVTGISLADALPLALVLALIFALAWLAKRFLRGRNILGGSGTVKILDRTPISPKQSLILVKVGERLILVGVSQEGMTALSEIDDPEQVAMLMGEAASYQPGSISRSFSDEVEDHRDEYMQQPMSEDPVEQTRGQVRGLLDKVRRFANYNDVA